MGSVAAVKKNTVYRELGSLVVFRWGVITAHCYAHVVLFWRGVGAGEKGFKLITDKAIAYYNGRTSLWYTYLS